MPDIFVSAKPWAQQEHINSSQTGVLGSWSAGPSFPVGLGEFSTIVTNSKVYVAGGRVNGYGQLSTVYEATIDASGVLGAWSLGTSLPSVRYGAATCVTKDRVFLIGGGTLTTVISAAIDASGNIGTWGSETAIPSARGYTAAVAVRSRLYLIGGYLGGALSTIVYAEIAEDGALGAWTSTTNYPLSVYGAKAIVSDDYVFVMGGRDAATNDSVDTIYKAAINTDGSLGTWTVETTVLPFALAAFEYIVVDSGVYIMGGYVSWDTGRKTCYYAPISSGVIGTFVACTVPYWGTYDAGMFATSSRLYYLGGVNSTSHYPDTQYTTFVGGLNDYTDQAFITEAEPGHEYDIEFALAPPLTEISLKFDSVIDISFDAPVFELVMGGQTTPFMYGSFASSAEIYTSITTDIVLNFSVSNYSPVIRWDAGVDIAVCPQCAEISAEFITDAIINVRYNAPCPTYGVDILTGNVGEFKFNSLRPSVQFEIEHESVFNIRFTPSCDSFSLNIISFESTDFKINAPSQSIGATFIVDEQAFIPVRHMSTRGCGS